jgi:hypothetical protein
MIQANHIQDYIFFEKKCLQTRGVQPIDFQRARYARVINNQTEARLSKIKLEKDERALSKRHEPQYLGSQ